MLPAKKAKLEARSLVSCSHEAARALLPQQDACRLGVLPLCIFSGDNLSVLSSKELTPSEIQELRFIVGHEVLVEKVPDNVLENAIQMAYESSPKKTFAALIKAEEQKTAIAATTYQSSAAVPEFLESLLRLARAREASDIHFSPNSDMTKVFFRVQGELQEQDNLATSHEVFEQLCRRIKVLSRIDTTQTRQPSDGSFSVNEEHVRVSFVPTVYGEKLVLRLLGTATALSADLLELGMDSMQSQYFRRVLDAGRGCVLLSGPTGSGKTTCLYSALAYLSASKKSIVTVEDPVELRLAGTSQVEVRKDESFSSYLRAVLRQDPDVLMLGEIRDADTARTALEAGITGHLVLSSVHAGNCIEVLLRLQELGVSRELLAMSTKLILSQRLVRLICLDCKYEVKSQKGLLGLPPDAPVYSSRGCNSCFQQGSSGRRAVFESLPLAPRIKELLCENFRGLQFYSSLRERCFEAGYRPLIHQLRQLVLEGKVSPEEALRAAGIA